MSDVARAEPPPAREPNQREQAAAEARHRILAAARDCIVRDGLAQVRMASIARQAGVSAGLLHYHFDTKEQLFSEVLGYSHAAFTALNEQAKLRDGSNPEQRLSLFLERCLPSDDTLAHEWLLWQELALLCIRRPELAEVGARLYEDMYATLTEIVDDGVRSGCFSPVAAPRVVAQAAVALCDGLGARVLANDPRLGLDDAWATLAATVGLLIGHDGPLPSPTHSHTPPTIKERS